MSEGVKEEYEAEGGVKRRESKRGGGKEGECGGMEGGWRDGGGGFYHPITIFHENSV